MQHVGAAVTDVKDEQNKMTKNILNIKKQFLHSSCLMTIKYILLSFFRTLMAVERFIHVLSL